MARAMDPKATFDFVLERDIELDEDEQTVWDLSESLPQKIYTRIVNAQQSNNFGDALTLCLLHGLRGVRNFLDSDGKDVKFRKDPTTGGPTLKFLDRINRNDQAELYEALMTRGNLSEGEQEKS